MSLAKQVHVGLPVLGTPGWITYMQVHKLFMDLNQNVTSYTALFQCIDHSHDYSHTVIDFAFKIPPVFTPFKLKSDLDATRLQENTPKIQNFPGEHAPGPPYLACLRRSSPKFRPPPQL